MSSFNIIISHSIIIYEDNQGCIKLGSKKKKFKRTKHIDIRHHFIQEHRGIGIIKLEYINTLEQRADMFIKLLPTSKLIHLGEKS